MKTKIKFAGPSQKMKAALDKEGLTIAWPKDIKSEEDLAIEGMFSTKSADNGKRVLINLRPYLAIGAKTGVDNAISYALQEAYTKVVELLEDLREEEKKLERFANVANAVATGRPIPPKELEVKDGETIHITPECARGIVEFPAIAINFF